MEKRVEDPITSGKVRDGKSKTCRASEVRDLAEVLGASEVKDLTLVADYCLLFAVYSSQKQKRASITKHAFAGIEICLRFTECSDLGYRLACQSR